MDKPDSNNQKDGSATTKAGSLFDNGKFLLGLFVFWIASFLAKEYMAWRGQERSADYVKQCFESEEAMQKCYATSAEFSEQCLKDENCAQTFGAGAQLGKDIVEKLQVICNYNTECAKNRISSLMQRAARSGHAMSELKTIETELETEIKNR